MVATAIYSVTMVLWKETAFPLCRAMERRFSFTYLLLLLLWAQLPHVGVDGVLRPKDTTRLRMQFVGFFGR